MKTTFRLLCILSLALLLTGAGKAVPELPNVQNLKHDAEQMQRERQVMVLFFTAEHCMYCQALQSRVLVPAVRSGEFEAQALFRTVRHDEPETRVVDFNGAQVSIRDLNQRYGVRVTPTLVFVNSQGEKVTQSLVGLLTEDFYGAYLAQNISEGVASLPPLSN